MTPEERAIAQRINARVDRIDLGVKVLVAERNLLRRLLFEAYKALQSLDLPEDGQTCSYTSVAAS